jgi:hypothetical protein
MNYIVGSESYGWYVTCHGSIFNAVTMRTMIFQKRFLLHDILSSGSRKCSHVLGPSDRRSLTLCTEALCSVSNRHIGRVLTKQSVLPAKHQQGRTDICPPQSTVSSEPTASSVDDTEEWKCQT